MQVLFDDTKHPHARWAPRAEALEVLRLLLEFADVFLLNEVPMVSCTKEGGGAVWLIH